MNLRDEFTKLVSWLHNTGLVDAINRTKNSEELKELWNSFTQTTRLLISEAMEWKRKFNSSKSFIFNPFEEITFPTEITCLIKIMGIDEEEIFFDKYDLQMALKKERKPFSSAIARLMENKPIMNITVEDIFSK